MMTMEECVEDFFNDPFFALPPGYFHIVCKQTEGDGSLMVVVYSADEPTGAEHLLRESPGLIWFAQLEAILNKARKHHQERIKGRLKPIFAL